MIDGVVFLVLTLLWAVIALLWPSQVGAALLSWCALASVYASTAYFFGVSNAFFKKPTGRRPVWIQVVIFPFFFFSWIALRLNRLFSREAPWNRIAERLYLGGIPFYLLNRHETRELPVDAVLDMTAEFDAPRFLRRGRAYLSVPTLDRTAPTLGELRKAVDFVVHHHRGGHTVYIHCALGHGRSATVLACALVVLGKAQGLEDATSLLKAQRPRVHLNFRQKRVARGFLKHPVPGPNREDHENQPPPQRTTPGARAPRASDAADKSQ